MMRGVVNSVNSLRARIPMKWRPMIAYGSGVHSTYFPNLRRYGIGRNCADTLTPNAAYRCVVCEKCFSRRSSLWNHKKLHSLIRHYGCAFCGKRYKWKNSLKAHAKVHLRKKEISSLGEIPDLKKLLRNQPAVSSISSLKSVDPLMDSETENTVPTHQGGQRTSGVRYNLPRAPTSRMAFRSIYGLANRGAVRSIPFGMNYLNGTFNVRGMYPVGNGIIPGMPPFADYGIIPEHANIFQTISTAAMNFNGIRFQNRSAPRSIRQPHVLFTYGTNPLNQDVPLTLRGQQRPFSGQMWSDRMER